MIHTFWNPMANLETSMSMDFTLIYSVYGFEQLWDIGQHCKLFQCLHKKKAVHNALHTIYTVTQIPDYIKQRLRERIINANGYQVLTMIVISRQPPYAIHVKICLSVSLPVKWRFSFSRHLSEEMSFSGCCNLISSIYLNPIGYSLLNSS